MRYYPVNLDIRGRDCLVIGGGEVAERKAETLLAAGARVAVLSPRLTERLAGLAREGKIGLQAAEYRPGAIGNYFIVICATDNAAVNAQAAEEARVRGALVNVADAPDRGDFVVPAQVSSGELMITVSTGGKSPGLARRIRQELAERYGPQYGEYLDLVARIREERKGAGAAADRRDFWRENLDVEVLALLASGRGNEAEEKIRNAIGGTGSQS